MPNCCGHKRVACSRPPGFRSPRPSVVVPEDAAESLPAPHLARPGRIESSMIVVALISEGGGILETVKYSAYGVPLLLNPADYNHVGFVNGDDYDEFSDDWDNTVTDADVNFDGYVNGTDFDDFGEAYDY